MKNILTRLFRKKLKIGIVGGCQTEGLREATLALLPDAYVNCWHAGVHADSPEQILKQLKTFDLVISQITPGHNLEILQMESLRRELKSVHFMPTVVFSGFHPDMTYIFDDHRPLSAVHSDFHSKIAVAGFLLNLTPKITMRLYNTLVFSELGYFEDFSAAKIVFEMYMQENELDGHLLLHDFFREIGPFMYMANHPHIQVLTRMCRDLYAKIGLIDAMKPLPKVSKDHLSESFTWPIYPDLAERAGVKGSMDFQKPAWLTPPGESRKLTMEQYLKDVHDYYFKIDRNQLETETILSVCDKLSELIS